MLLIKKEVKYLSHIIDKNGAGTDPAKTETVRYFGIPKCVKNLRSFLGICNYYRRFIKDYSKKSRKLEALCRTGNLKLVWTDDCETAFQDMKAILTETPVLCFSDTRKEFILDTNASFEAIGAVL